MQDARLPMEALAATLKKCPSLRPEWELATPSICAGRTPSGFNQKLLNEFTDQTMAATREWFRYDRPRPLSAGESAEPAEGSLLRGVFGPRGPRPPSLHPMFTYLRCFGGSWGSPHTGYEPSAPVGPCSPEAHQILFISDVRAKTQ